MLFKQVDVVKDNFSNFDISIENCIMEQTMEFNFKYIELKRKMIRLEAYCLENNNEVLLENGLEEFFKGIIRLLQNLWNMVKDMYNKFTKRLVDQVNMNTQLLKRYDQKVFMKDITGFSTDGYVYTLDKEIDFECGAHEIRKMPNQFTEAEYLKLSEERNTICNTIRGNVIHDKVKLDQKDYSIKLFRYFRNNCISQEKLAINNQAEFKASLINGIKNIQNQRKKANELSYKVDKFYSSAIKYFKELSASGNSEEERKYYMEKMELSKDIANIYNEAFSELLRAINENYAQNKRIIVEILNYKSDDVITSDMVFVNSNRFGEVN